MTKEYRYIVIGRYTEGVNVLGYVVQDIESGETRLLDRNATEKMAMSKFIANVGAQVYEGKIIMKGIDCKLSSLPNYDKDGNIVSKQIKTSTNANELEIKARILEGKSTVGYVISLLTNGVKCGEKKVSRQSVIELARKGHITNARVQMSNGKPVLRGVNCELARLPSAKIN